MINVNENGKVTAKDIYYFVEVKTQFNKWVTRCIDTADLKLNKDFWKEKTKSTGGRPAIEYEFTIDAAKEVCLVSATSKAKELRRWLIDLSNKTENLELITVKQAAFAVKVINCLKYIENQKEAYNVHKDTFVKENVNTLNPKYIYSDFAKYRSSITGWDKKKVDNAINEYLDKHSGYNRNKVMKKDINTKLSIMDIGEAIRVAILDILFAKHTNEDMAVNFSNLCKRLTNEMQIDPDKKNEVNLFKAKEDILTVGTIDGRSLRS
jgi:anti-repressor protein